MKKYLFCACVLMFLFTNCGEPLPDEADQKSSTAPANNAANAGLTPDFGTPGNVSNPPLIPPPATGSQPPAVNPAPAEDNSTSPIYRFYNTIRGDHMSSGSATEVGSPWTPDGQIYSVFRVPYPHRHPVYRCYVVASGDHFTSNDRGCEGHTFEGTFGYLENTPTAVAGRAIYRCFNLIGHLDTTNSAECTDNGYTIEGILGYVP